MLRRRALHDVYNGILACYTTTRTYHLENGVFGHVPQQSKSEQPPVLLCKTSDECKRLHLINAYRRYGYLGADTDPLGLQKPPMVPELNAELYGLSKGSVILVGGKQYHVEDLVDSLRHIYCGNIGAEFMHLINWAERSWFASEFEALHSAELAGSERVQIAELMLKCQNFDHFLAVKFPSVKRYGCEGAECIIAFLHELFQSAATFKIEDIFLCMAHRGRLNILCELMNFPAVQMFRKMKGKLEFPDEVQGVGDVLSHLTSSVELETDEGNVNISMLPNPSHLEAVNPVAMGKTRARSASKRIGDYGQQDSRPGDQVLCVQIHGDGAFVGQGVVMETLSLSNIPHFRVGGSLHVVTNNQIAYTAESHTGRSTAFVTDLAKAIDAPVLHINGDNPELMVKATRLAMKYRDVFRKDVFLDLICYRRWGHNELDVPHFTQPLMYKVIDARKSVPDKYVDQLIEDGIMSQKDKEEIIAEHTSRLMADFRAIDSTPPNTPFCEKSWYGMIQAPHSVETWDTGFDVDLLRFIGAKSVSLPEGFAIHPHLKKVHVDARTSKMELGTNIDWATAESLAFGSLLLQGFDVRISGQDVGRGTFSQRHAMFVDQNSDEVYVPLNHLDMHQTGFLEIANSPLSEEAVLGYEYGFSVESPKRLCIWEAQFGDFFNGAQVQIDTCITSGESKWLCQSGLVMILPHGFDGAGPEHSTCRMERFLQACNSREDQKPPDGESVNIHVVNPTTSAQYFHLLRKQVVTPYRKPLIIIGPKILLRHPKAASTLADMSKGTSFKTVIDDKFVSPEKVKKVIFVSGKHCYALMNMRDEKKLNDVAVIRLESLCPFPVDSIQKTISKYPNATKFVWSQEEPRNAGAWSFVQSRFMNVLGIELQYCGRPELAWTATAIANIHSKESEQILNDTFAA
ncbi:hypothetical protein AB6A40_001318 [Gnathostoma spinigerum]|uniref:Transketolase-like pyrimidine-binding domain-containing protein n=1 Tax=Gnathostoma spinigerum TaxID=75299 RepID=A0ABD6E3V8_9BILA